MKKVAWLVLLILGTCLSKPNSEADQIKVLAARVDSLSRALEKAELAASYAEKTIGISMSANDSVRTQYLAFVGSTVLVLLAGFGAIGYFIYRRTSDERDYIADKVKEMLAPIYSHEIGELDKDFKELDGELRKHLRNYNNFAAEIEKKDKQQDELINASTTALPAIANQYTKLKDTVESNRVSNIEKLIEVLDQLQDENQVRHDVLRSLIYIELMLRNIYSIKESKEGKRKYADAFARLDTLVNSNGDFKMAYFPNVKAMYSFLAEKDQVHFETVEQHLKQRGKNN